MKNSRLLWPALGIGTAILTVLAPFFIIRFAPSPDAFAVLSLAILLVALVTFGYLGSKRGHAAVFVAIALVLPYLVIGAVAYASIDRASSELGSIFEDDTEFAPEDDFLDEGDGFEPEDGFLDEEGESSGDGTYGSDPDLDALQDACVAGDTTACDDLYFQAPGGSEYESTAEQYGEGF